MDRFHKLIFYIVPALLGFLAFYLNEYSTAVVRVERNIQYGSSALEKLDLCRPPRANELAPVVILIHGGAWITGDKKDNVPAMCRSLAKNGIFAVNINYRLFSGAKNENYWPAQLQDAQLAVRWLRVHAADYHIDPNKICAGGISAGGQLALFLGAMKKNLPGDRDKIYPQQRPDVQCVVADQAVTDLSAGIPSLEELIKYFVRAKPGEDRAKALRDASPVNFITHDMPPVLVIQGDQDSIIPPNQPEKLLKALKDNNVPYEHIVFHGDHIYQGAPQSEYLNAMDRQLQFYMKNLLPRSPVQ